MQHTWILRYWSVPAKDARGFSRSRLTQPYLDNAAKVWAEVGADCVSHLLLPGPSRRRTSIPQGEVIQSEEDTLAHFDQGSMDGCVSPAVVGLVVTVAVPLNKARRASRTLGSAASSC